MADTYRPYVAELADKRGYIHPIHAKQLAEERTVTMTGDVTGTANWDFGEPASSSQASESMALSIGEKKVTTAKLDDGAVTTPKVADDAVTLAKIDDNAMNGTVQDNDSKLATHAAVKTYVDSQISGQGTYLGKKTVAEVNAMNVNNLHNGDRVQMADAGTINLGPGGVGFDVVAGEDLILYKSGSTVQWDTMDGDFKTKQSPVSDPAADGTTITAIDTVSQNANGEITATKKTIRTGNGSNTGVVKLSDSTSSTSGVSGGVAATPAAVKAAYDLASGKKDKQAAIDTDTSSGSGKGGTTRTLTRLQQDANGVITPTFADIPTASAQTKGLMGTAEYTKLSGIAEGATKTEASSTNGNIKIDGTETTVYSHPTQTAYTGKPTADAAPAFGGTFTVSQVTTNGTGHVTGLTDRTITIPSATATTSSNGLMSSSDKSKLDGIAEGAEVNQNAFGNVKVGNATIEADSKTDTLEIAGGTGIDAVGDTANDKVTLSLDSATQTSLGKADSAVQDVTVDGASVVNSSTKVAAVPNASTSAKGAVQLAGSIGATVASENNKAATEKAVRDAINALDAEVTSNDGTNVQVKVTEADGKISAVNVTTDNTENKNNKVSAWQTTPDDTHYPSEKLVKYGLDAKADSENVIARYDARVATNTNNRGWYKLAEVTTSSTTTTYNSSWSVDVATSISNVNLMSFTINLAVRLNGSGVAPEIREFKALCLDNESIGNSSIPSFFVIVNGNSGNVAIQLWYYYNNVGSVLIRELCSGINLLESRKRLWTYYTYNLVAGSDTKPTGTLNKDIDFIYAQTPIASPTNNNLVAMDANGLVKDSGLTKSSVESAISAAGSAIQGVKVNDTTLTPDANKVVTVPLATTSADGAMSAADKTKLNGIAEGAEVNVQADWNATSGDALIKNKPHFVKDTVNAAAIYKVCSFVTTGPRAADCFTLDVVCRYGTGGFFGQVVFKDGFKFFCKFSGNTPATDTQFTVKFYYKYENSVGTVYADSPMYVITHYAPAVNCPKSYMDFTEFGTITALPEGATEIPRVWVANASASSGTAPVKVDAYGALTPVPMDSTPTASSTNLMTSGDIKTALDKKANLNNFRTAVGIKGLKLRFSANANLYDGVFATILNGYGGLAYRSITFGIRRQSNALPSVHRYNTEISSGDYSTGKNFSLYYGTDPSDENYKILLIVPAGSIQGLLNLSTSGTASEWSLLSETPSTDGLTQITPTEHTNVFGANKGSASVPVYVDASGAATPCTDDFVHDGDVAQTYSSTSEAPISGKGVTEKNLLKAVTLTSSDSIDNLNSKMPITTRGTRYLFCGDTAVNGTFPGSKKFFQLSVLVQHQSLTYLTQELWYTDVYNDYHYTRKLVNGTWQDWKIHWDNTTSSYSSSSTQPVNGTAVAAALATSLTDVEYVAAQSGGGGNLNKTKNGSTTSVLAFMTTAEATSLWQSAWAAAN